MDDFIKEFDNFTQSWWPYTITFLISIVSAIRIYVAGTYCQSTNRIDGKNVIITGASSGIGFQTAIELASKGGNVILAVRNAEKGRKAISEIRQMVPNANVVVKIVDMSELNSIKNFVNHIKKEYEKIDILINNAAVVFQSFSRTLEGHELTFVTNYLGPFLLTHLMLPLLNNTENGRVINISALAHYNGTINLKNLDSAVDYSDRGAFSQSKLALTVFTKHMASLCKGTKITFNSVNPGLVRNTGHMKNSSLQGSFFTKLSVWPWVWLFMKTPKQGCQSIVYLAIEPTLYNVSGCYFSNCSIKDPAEAVLDVNLGRTLYLETCKILDIDGQRMIQNLTETNEK